MMVPVLLAAAVLAAPDLVAQEEADFLRHCIQPGQLKRLVLETPLVQTGQPQAFLAIPDDSAHRRRAATLNQALRETTGVELPVRPAAAVTDDDLQRSHVVLLGHLENNPVLARLYHNFYDCLD
ncbi:MAG: hypothetical protein QHJ73_17750, partial [Armatimonadota bacterium]|nr:hypothetical protein [Armatimonadota bacterium]